MCQKARLEALLAVEDSETMKGPIDTIVLDADFGRSFLATSCENYKKR